jgi:hypothetical protein
MLPVSLENALFMQQPYLIRTLFANFCIGFANEANVRSVDPRVLVIGPNVERSRLIENRDHCRARAKAKRG